MSKWMITGGGGFVASHFIDLLQSEKEEVCVTYRWNEDLSRIKHVENITRIPADLLDLSSLIRAVADHKPDVISHLAAQSFVNDSFVMPIITVETNTVGTVNLMEAVRIVRDYIHNGYDPVIHVCSSSEVYGRVNADELPITEQHPFRPGNQYAIGKIGEDATADFYHKYYGFKVITTRMFTHTGPGRTMMSAENNFARQIARIEHGLQEPVIRHGNLDSVRTWADVRDAVRAYYLLGKNGRPGEAYNIGGKDVRTIAEMLDFLISLSPMADKIKKEVDPSLIRRLDVNLQVPDCSKFQRDTGWEPVYTFERTMEDLLNWWRVCVVS